MTKVTDIKSKQELCEWCGEPAHLRPLMCPRVTKVKYTSDDEIIVFFTDAPIIMQFNGPKLET